MNPEIEQALTGGPQTAAALLRRAGISQPTLSRLLARERARIAVLGRGRSTRYALRRTIRELPPELPIHRVSPDGSVARIGTLLTLEPDRYWYEDREQPRRSAEFLALPWFMTDMRPQGYLGRLFPQIYTDLGLPARITEWTEDQALYALARRGEDVPGNLLIGEESHARWLVVNAQSRAIPESERLAHYARLATEVVAGRPPGSSAAGEQPKFGAVVRAADRTVRHTLVKFSGPMQGVAARRWADLLLAEHLASVVLREHGHAAVRSEFLGDATRAYLEVERFDRVGAIGRLGVVSLGALDDEFLGARSSWSESGSGLLRAGWVREDDARELRFLSAYGALIGNTDMHLGNVSFLVSGPMQLQLAPAYDMLPMLYAPVADEVSNRNFQPPSPTPGQADQWQRALPVARTFWLRLAGDERATADMRRLAADNAAALASAALE